jgi:hypothetical protein
VVENNGIAQTTDTSDPVWPEGAALVVSELTPHALTLTWTSATDDVSIVSYRITQDGVAQEIHFPNRFDVYRFISGRIWGVQRDEFDVASVAWIEVPGSR